jgi:hypothetical protein
MMTTAPPGADAIRKYTGRRMENKRASGLNEFFQGEQLADPLSERS